MEHTHEYDCIVCGAHFDDSQSLARHNKDKHLQHATGMEKPRSEESPKNDEQERSERRP